MIRGLCLLEFQYKCKMRQNKGPEVNGPENTLKYISVLGFKIDILHFTPDIYVAVAGSSNGG